MLKFILNHEDVSTDMPPGMLLLDFIRYHRQLKGTKIGCREGDCGACTVMVGELVNDEMKTDGEKFLLYRTATSCLMPIGNATGKHIVTIEGISMGSPNPVQRAMADEGATQCGFCTPGFVMSLAGFCLSRKKPAPDEAIASVDGNICRCTGYKSIERAALSVHALLAGRKETSPVQYATENNLLPKYFSGIENRLSLLTNEIEKLSGTFSNGLNQALVSGGTDLYVQKHDVMADAEINFLSDKNFLKGISRQGNRCVIGASTTVSDLCESLVFNSYFPEFTRYAKLISSTQIRNMATMAGNFVNASPIGDLTVFFLALNSVLVLSDGNASREVPLAEFYKGYKILDKKPEEYVEQLYFEWPAGKSLFNFEKVSKRTHLDIASVNSAMLLKMDGDTISGLTISAGGVSPIPMVLRKTSDFFQGKKISAAIIDEAVGIMQSEIAPIGDARGSEAYKRLLLSQLLKAHFIELFPELISQYQ